MIRADGPAFAVFAKDDSTRLQLRVYLRWCVTGKGSWPVKNVRTQCMCKEKMEYVPSPHFGFLLPPCFCRMLSLEILPLQITQGMRHPAMHELRQHQRLQLRILCRGGRLVRPALDAGAAAISCPVKRSSTAGVRKPAKTGPRPICPRI